ncbi:MAG: hypothetical protein Tsb0020_01610 [Haliangiales bacterium]
MYKLSNLMSRVTLALGLISTLAVGTSHAQLTDGLTKQGPIDLGLTEQEALDQGLQIQGPNGNVGTLRWLYVTAGTVTLGANNTQIVDHVEAGITYKRVPGWSRSEPFIFVPMYSFQVGAVFTDTATGDEWSEWTRVRYRFIGTDISQSYQSAPADQFNDDIYLYEFDILIGDEWKPLFQKAVVAHGLLTPNGDYWPNVSVTLAGTRSSISKCMRGYGYKAHHSVHGDTFASLLGACIRAMAADYCGDGESHTVAGTSVALYDGTFVQESPSLPNGYGFEALFDASGALHLSDLRYEWVSEHLHQELVHLQETSTPTEIVWRDDGIGGWRIVTQPEPTDYFYCDSGASIPLQDPAEMASSDVPETSIKVKSDPAFYDWSEPAPSPGQCAVDDPFC